MNKALEELKEYNNLWIKSKIKFQWDFKETLEKLVWKLKTNIAKEIIPNYGVEYTAYWTQIIKVKIKDKNLMVEKLITCTLFFSKNDEIYWYVTPLFTSVEKWQKTRKHELDKFSISKNEEIVKAVVGKLVEIIEEF